MDLAIRNATIVDGTGAAARTGDLGIDDGRIVAVGDVESFDAHRRIDATDCLVLPGLINLHTHLPMTLLRGVAENVDLQGFLEAADLRAKCSTRGNGPLSLCCSRCEGTKICSLSKLVCRLAPRDR